MSPAQPIVLAIRNDTTSPALLVGEWLEEAGIAIRTICADEGEHVPDSLPRGVHGILALGGSIGAADDAVAPWLAAERALLADAVGAGVPVLGLCLGGQLLASAMGGCVELGPTQEIGLSLVRRTVDGLNDPVASQAEPTRGPDIPAAQWHQDFVTELPEGAVLLFTNEVCRVQGFRIGEAGYGLQMHPEVDGATFVSWAEVPDEALRRSGVDARHAAEAVAAAEPELITAWRPMTRAWADLVWARFGSVVPA